jgi:hypothetical protein
MEFSESCMKRDMDLIRELLLKLEDLSKPPSQTVLLFAGDPRLTAEGFTHEQIDYHLSLLREVRFIECPGSQPAGGGVNFRRLTWDGHDFLDSVRDPKIWEKTKKGADAAGGFTVDLLKDLAKGFIKKQIEEYTGVKL